MKKSRVVMGKSWVRHGFVMGLEEPGFFRKPGVFVEKSRVVMAKSRVCHGFVTGC